MTTATYDATGGVVTIKLVGHAGYNPGNDIVCSAISTMSYALINQLYRMAESDAVYDLEVADVPGNIRITFKVADRDYFSNIREFWMMGMEMIAEHYPDYLTIEERR